MQKLSSIYQKSGNLKKALTFQQKSLIINNKNFKENHPNIATSYNNIATIYQDMGDFENALKSILHCLSIRKEILEDNHPYLASTYDILASIFKALNKFEEALEAEKKAITIWEQAEEVNHIFLAMGYNKLSSIFCIQEKTNQVIRYQEKAYKIWKENLPDSHTTLKTVKTNLIFWYKKRGIQFLENKIYDEAIQDFQKVLEFQPNHANTMNNLGLCYYYRKDYKNAIQYYNQSYQIDSTNQTVYLNNTGIAYAKWNKIQEAKSRFEQLQKLIPGNAIVYRDWTLYYTIKEDFPTALDNLEKAISLGYKDLNWLQTDESLEPLRQEERYKKIIQELQPQVQKEP